AVHEISQAGNRIVDALTKAGLPADAIETGDASLSRVSPDDNWTPEMKKQRLFEARQSWRFRVKAAEGEKFLSAAAQAGSNEIETPAWEVADPSALQAKAGAAALVKARKVAEQMASGLGAHLGELVYASNRVPAGFMYNTLNTESGMM